MKNILENLIKEFNAKSKTTNLDKNSILILEIILKNLKMDSKEIKNLLEVNGDKSISTIENLKKQSKDLFNKFLEIVKSKDIEKLELFRIELNNKKEWLNKKKNKKEFTYSIPMRIIIITLYNILKKYNIKIDTFNYLILNREFFNSLLDQYINQEINKNSVDENLTDEYSNKKIINFQQEEFDKYELEIETLKNELIYEKETLKNQIITDFFREMNSSSNNELLDNLYKIGLELNQLESKENISIEDFDSISLTIKLFFKYLKKNKVLPKEKIGNILEINLEDAQKYNYLGTEFLESNEIKKVKIETTGWKINNDIITKPTVKEVN